MKKTYIVPASEVISLNTETPILSNSPIKEIHDDEAISSKDEMLSNKNVWNYPNWE